ncbi:hypothetical protein DTO169E5_4744 [Paecilomyces variotii]|nr:hypothetical protein DTO169E5_4744 [Paecilomyces variotii]
MPDELGHAVIIVLLRLVIDRTACLEQTNVIFLQQSVSLPVQRVRQPTWLLNDALAVVAVFNSTPGTASQLKLQLARLAQPSELIDLSHLTSHNCSPLSGARFHPLFFINSFDLTLSSHVPESHIPVSTVSPANRRALDETYEIYDPSTLTNVSPQRQQQSAHDPALPPTQSPLPRPSSATGSGRSLRRVTPRLEDRHAIHRRAVSIDETALQNLDLRPAEQGSAVPPQNPPGLAGGIADLPPALSEVQTEGEESTTQTPHPRLLESYWPPRSGRVSPRTASAIFWVLEEAIRRPFPFTPDLDEENASMSEVMSGGGSPAPGMNPRAQNGSSRSAQGPVPVHTQPPSGVRTPTDIMRQRRDREARKKAEKEAKEREQQEAEMKRQQEQEQMTQAQTQYTAAGVAGDTASQRKVGIAPQQDPRIRHDRGGGSVSVVPPTGFQQTSAPGATQRQETGNVGTAERPRASTIAQGQPKPVPPNSQQPPHATSAGYAPQQSSQFQPRPPGMPSQTGPQPAASGPQQPQSSQGSQSQPRRATFPHAFERWETLSSHWEGLTGYWIRKLEQSNEELSRDPISQQLARQVTDLSAAGANLFHAVVELQRLRASSERKFQRWFFDTRAEQERAQEKQAELERQLRVERQQRAEAVASSQKSESEKAKAEQLVKEMRRELQISKEEARRAWEELGRREQEERDRTTSLRNGEPTLVGGVQVVPMIQGVPSRQGGTNRPPTREGPYPGGPGPSSMGGQGPQGPQGSGSEEQYYEEQPSSPTEDPFIEGGRPSTTQSQVPSSGAYSHGQETGRFYQHEGSALHAGRPTSEPDDQSYRPSTVGTESDLGEEEYGADPGYRRDPEGRRTYPRAMSEGSEEYEGEPEEEQEYSGDYTSGAGYGSLPAATTGAPLHSGYGQGVDYSGSTWGSGWDSVTPRHRHPTRLSDVIEEDERSRTSPSRASQASRGMQ